MKFIKKNNYKNKIIKIICLLILIFTITITINKEEHEYTIETSSTISNQKIGWGIKRNDNHEQPDLGANRLKVLSENNGIAIGNKESKKIYLTFDQGYEAGYTKEILKVLKENNVTATFFITAHYLNTQPELIKQMIEENHIVGNHTVKHKSMPDLSNEEIKEEILTLHQTIYEKFQYEMKYMRPPMGEYSERSLITTNQLGYTTVMWSFAYKDWEENNQPSQEEAIKKITENFHPGEIMLLHGNSKTNANILPEIIKQAREQGYEFYSLDEFEK